MCRDVVGGNGGPSCQRARELMWNETDIESLGHANDRRGGGESGIADGVQRGAESASCRSLVDDLLAHSVIVRAAEDIRIATRTPRWCLYRSLGARAVPLSEEQAINSATNNAGARRETHLHAVKPPRSCDSLRSRAAGNPKNLPSRGTHSELGMNGPGIAHHLPTLYRGTSFAIRACGGVSVVHIRNAEDSGRERNVLNASHPDSPCVPALVMVPDDRPYMPGKSMSATSSRPASGWRFLSPTLRR